ncbi:hypothetical protein [Streptomyces mesophilus]|uniref:hypothetical protein n=1 Tax=Streptomyces mesophilus TaxID=1775132 RepID=UPI00333141E3
MSRSRHAKWLLSAAAAIVFAVTLGAAFPAHAHHVSPPAAVAPAGDFGGVHKLIRDQIDIDLDRDLDRDEGPRAH